MTAGPKNELTIAVGFALFLLAVAFCFFGCASTLPDTVLKARNQFCGQESCPAQLVVRPWLKLLWGVYDPPSDSCYCVMRDDAGHERTLIVPRGAPADSKVQGE